jgi:hypothetical protein
VQDRTFRRIKMDVEAVRREISRVIKGGEAEPNLTARLSGARRAIIAAGIDALHIEYSNGLSLGDVLLQATTAPPTPDRRSFAALIVAALANEGLIPSTSQRADIDRNLCSLVESAVPEILNRFKYPFKEQTYAKRRALEGLHASLVEFLSPLTSPGNDLSGLLSNRSRLTKCLTEPVVETYFGTSSVRDLFAGVQRVFETLCDLRQQEDAAFHANLPDGRGGCSTLTGFARGALRRRRGCGGGFSHDGE